MNSVLKNPLQSHWGFPESVLFPPLTHQNTRFPTRSLTCLNLLCFCCLFSFKQQGVNSYQSQGIRRSALSQKLWESPELGQGHLSGTTAQHRRRSPDSCAYYDQNNWM